MLKIQPEVPATSGAIRLVRDSQCTEALSPSAASQRHHVGWVKQQLVKLACARTYVSLLCLSMLYILTILMHCAELVHTPFYLLLDVDLFFTEPVTSSAWLDTGQCTNASQQCCHESTAFRARNDMWIQTGASRRNVFANARGCGYLAQTSLHAQLC